MPGVVSLARLSGQRDYARRMRFPGVNAKTDGDGSLLEGGGKVVDVLQLVDRRCAPTDSGEQVGAMTSTALTAFDSTTALAFSTFSYVKNDIPSNVLVAMWPA